MTADPDPKPWRQDKEGAYRRYNVVGCSRLCLASSRYLAKGHLMNSQPVLNLAKGEQGCVHGSGRERTASILVWICIPVCGPDPGLGLF